MRLMVKPLKVLKIDAGAQGGFIEFSPSAKVDPEKFIKLIQQNPIVYRFDGPYKSEKPMLSICPLCSFPNNSPAPRISRSCVARMNPAPKLSKLSNASKRRFASFRH